MNKAVVKNLENNKDDIIFENKDYIVTLNENIVFYSEQEAIINKAKTQEKGKHVNIVLSKYFANIKYRLMSKMIEAMSQNSKNNEKRTVNIYSKIKLFQRSS